jgi:hypothetical protein
VIPKAAHFVIYTIKLTLRHSYPLTMIGNTPVWLDMPGDTSIARVGSRSVQYKQLVMEKEGLQLPCLPWQLDES